jgi:hypothetical protein
MIFENTENTMFENSPLQPSDMNISAYHQFKTSRRSSTNNKSMDCSGYKKPLNLVNVKYHIQLSHRLIQKI